MNKLFTFLAVFTSAVWLLSSCSADNSAKEGLKIPVFPYQSYLDSIGEDEYFPTIGDDGQGFNAISHKIRYPKLPDTLTSNLYADSLLQFYNIALAYNTLAYDNGSAERYMSEPDRRLSYADALDSINLHGISNSEIKNRIQKVAENATKCIRDSVELSAGKTEAIKRFYDVFNICSSALYSSRLTDDEFAPQSVLADYEDIHTKSLTDTTSFREELLNRTLAECDFSKKCVLAREYAYANYNSPKRNDKEVVAVIDTILRSNKYSPLLRDLWRMWRVMLQINIFGGRSNDSAMYNLFYNDMRNRIALIYIKHLCDNPNDGIAFKEFIKLAADHNIVRNGGIPTGNNANFEDIELFYSVFHPDDNENETTN